MLIRNLRKVVFTPGHKPESHGLFLRAHIVPIKCIPKCVSAENPQFQGIV